MNDSSKSPNIAIEVQKLSKTFDERQALKGIDLKIEAGEAVVIFGPNGAGKTTLLKILSTIMAPTSGSVKIDGLNIKEHPEEARAKIGVVGHTTYLYANLTAFENLDFYRRLYGIEPARILQVAEIVGMQSRLQDRVSSLSRGMQQRFSIARALLHDPQIMLLDEPETGLDQEAIAFLWSAIRGREGRRRTLVFTTHSLERGLEIADSVLILSRGKIVHQSAAAALSPPSLKEIYQQKTRPTI
jgi:heme ABC exporter ATP-binding subunit CcmA